MVPEVRRVVQQVAVVVMVPEEEGQQGLPEEQGLLGATRGQHLPVVMEQHQLLKLSPSTRLTEHYMLVRSTPPRLTWRNTM